MKLLSSSAKWTAAAAMAALVFTLLPVAAVAAPPEKPESFPKVMLKDDSVPRYSAIYVDPWHLQIAYLLFDGNVEDGYKRVYVWIPDDSRFSKPREFKVGGDGINFSDFEFNTVHGEEKTDITWHCNWRRHNTGGKHVSRNYATGEVTTRITEVQVIPQFFFLVDYQRTPKSRLARPGEREVVDLGINGWLPIAAGWEDLPKPTAPWENLWFGLKVEPIHETDGGTLRLTGQIYYRHWHHWPCEVRSMPDDCKIYVKVAPYLEDPLYEENLDENDVFGKTIDVPAAYGWYSIDWGIDSELLKVPAHRDPYKPLYPFTRPLATAK